MSDIKKDVKSGSSLTFKIFIPVVAIFILFFLAGLLRIFYEARIEKKHFIAQVKESSKKFREVTERLSSDYLQMALILANSPVVKEAILNQDRQKLIEYTERIWKELNRHSEYPIKIHFHLPPARSFLRIWKPQKWGDDLQSFRHTVVKVIRTGEPVKGIEAGRVGLAVRGIAPIFYEGRVIGSVEVFSSLNAVAEELRQFLKEDNTILWLETVKTTVATEKVKGYVGKLKVTLNPLNSKDLSLITPVEAERALKDMLILEKEDVLISLIPILDFSGRPVGVYARFQNLKPFKNKLYRQLIVQTSVLIIGLVVVLAIIYGIIKTGVIDSLTRVINSIQNIVISTGRVDLRHSVPLDGPSEIRSLGITLNYLINTLKILLKDIHESTNKVVDASEKLAEDAERVNKDSSLVKQSVNHVKEYSQKVVEMIEETSRSIDHFVQSIQEITQGIENTSQAIARMEDFVKSAVNKIEELAQDSEQISSMVSSIEEIASQTNLLALNASIEAARAGEAGKGFAVVANEVKELSQQTTLVTEKIKDIVSLIQSKVQEAVTIIKEVNAAVSKVEDHAQKIAEVSEEQKSVAESIRHNVDEKKEKAEIMLNEMLSTEEVVKDFIKVASGMAEIQKELEVVAKELKENTSKFVI